MTVTRGLALLLTVATAGALVNASSAPDGASTTVRLKAISARVHAKGASLVIEASEPVAYTASRPDALTVLLDFRNVGASNVANSVAADVKSPIAHVSVEVVQSLGAPASRVRIALSQPVAHHVRSERNTVIVDFDKPSAKAAPFVLPPSSRQSAVGSQQSSSTPDAMLALQGAPTGNPIAALGLDPVPGGPSASSTSVVTMAVPSARPPVVVQSPDKVAALLAAAVASCPAACDPAVPVWADCDALCAELAAAELALAAAWRRACCVAAWALDTPVCAAMSAD